MTIALPVVLASLLSVILSPALGPLEVDLLVVDQDQGPGARAIVDRLVEHESVEVEEVSLDVARARIEDGDASVGLILPEGTSAALTPGGFLDSETPTVQLLYDPTRGAEVEVVAGAVLEASMKRVFATLDAGGPEGLGLPDADGLRPPLELERDAVGVVDTAHAFDLHAHFFAGMLAMFVLFTAMEQARQLLAERRGGTLLRLRLAGVSRASVLLSTLLSTAILASAISVAIYAAGAVLFEVSVEGSWLGFVALLLAQAVFAGSFAVLLAGLARTERQAVNVGTAVILLSSFLGGAWLPSFLFPESVEWIGRATPTWWATHGLASVTWRGLGLDAVMLPLVLLLGLSLVTALVGGLRFRWSA